MRLTLSSGIRRLSREQGETPRWVARGAEGDVSVIGPVGRRINEREVWRSCAESMRSVPTAPAPV